MNKIPFNVRGFVFAFRRTYEREKLLKIYVIPPRRMLRIPWTSSSRVNTLILLELWLCSLIEGKKKVIYRVQDWTDTAAEQQLLWDVQWRDIEVKLTEKDDDKKNWMVLA